MPGICVFLKTTSRHIPSTAGFNAAPGREAEDTFPTHYRANTRRDLRAVARETNMELIFCEITEGRP